MFYALIKTAKLTRHEDKERLLAASISQWLSQVLVGWTTHLHQPVHWVSRKKNKEVSLRKGREKKTKEKGEKNHRRI